jgi:hypothetical protein
MKGGGVANRTIPIGQAASVADLACLDIGWMIVCVTVNRTRRAKSPRAAGRGRDRKKDNWSLIDFIALSVVFQRRVARLVVNHKTEQSNSKCSALSVN